MKKTKLTKRRKTTQVIFSKTDAEREHLGIERVRVFS